MAHFHALGVAPRANPQERYAVAMTGVHIGLYLEDETTERGLACRHLPGGGGAGQGRGRPADKIVQHLAHAEIAQGGTEEDRAEAAGEELLLVKLVAGAPHQFDLLQEIIVLISQQRPGGIALQSLDTTVVGQTGALARGVLVDHVGIEVVDPLELAPHAHRPVDGGALDGEHLLDLVQQIDGIADVAVHLVDETENGRIPQPAHVHQLDGAVLHTLGPVNHHQGGIHRGQGAVGVLGKVLVAGGIQQVDGALPVGELHHRGGHRDAPLLLHGHPVRGGVRPSLAFHAAGHLDGVAQQQELLRDGGLASVRVRNNGEGTARVDLLAEV